MRKIILPLCIIVSSFLPVVVSAQSIEQLSTLEQFAVAKKSIWLQQRSEAEATARLLGLPIREEGANGFVIELQRIENGVPLYFKTHNITAAATISTNRAWPGGSGGFSLTGSTDTLGVWDGGKVRDTHQEFGGRVILSDGAVTNSAHATHVSGTMIASGVNASAKGMSYQGRLRSYDWNTDLSEMATAAAGGLRVSNHSYGFITGWYHNGVQWQWYGDTGISTAEDYRFGFYDDDARDVDIIAVNAPYYLIAKSAGNDRLDGPSSQPVTHGHFGSGSFTDTHDLNGGPSGYDCIGNYGVSKNVLTVGAVGDIPAGYTTPGGVAMSSFSSWGPVDDGRIKPDIVANGIGLTSSVSSSNSAYSSYDGTSMATPNASGSLGLLLQMRKIIAGNVPMRASTLKGLVIHTADEAGANVGPDYAFGWGLMNTLKAAQVMRADSLAGMNKYIRELTLSQGQTIDVLVNSDGSQPLRATICWTDPAGTPPSVSLDPTTIMLVNDLDLRIISGTTYSPWVLNPASPATAATTGDNIRDNVEQVHIASPSNGQYTVRITHKGTLSGGSQAVSLIISGGTFGSSIAVVSPNGSESWAVGSAQPIQWSSSGVSGNIKIELSRDGGATFTETLFASIVNDGTENWTVTSPVTATARIKISSVTTPAVADTSNANFSIVQPSITVVTPNGGQVWSIGVSQTIQWSSSNVTGNVKIDLSRDGGATFPEVLFASTSNDGSQSWTTGGPVSASARIKVSAVSSPSVADTSDANFSIVQPSITLIQPNGGEAWAAGSLQTIQWSSANLTGNFAIQLSRDGGASFPEVLFASLGNDGSESWTVTGPASSNVRLRIASLSLPSVTDTSNANFSITQPSLTVVAPNGGEVWGVGNTHGIQWTSSLVTGDVKIELSRNGGASYSTLIANTANDGSEDWEVDLPVTAQARIRVRSVADTAIHDVSNGNFTISDSYALLAQLILRDNGGEFDTLTFGTSVGATDGVDPAYGEVELPPIPPTGAFDTRWDIATTTGIRRDIRGLLGGPGSEIVYSGRMQPGGGGYPFVLLWNSGSFPSGGFSLRDQFGGSFFSVDMKDQDSLVITNPAFTTFEIVYSNVTTVQSAMVNGWNMLSVPVTVSDRRTSEVFPTSISSAFSFSAAAGYSAEDTLHYGAGYWIKFPSAQNVSVTGVARVSDTINVAAGWNLIGSISTPVPVDSILEVPSGIVVSAYFGFGAPSYTATDTVHSMKAYWVKTNQSGQLVIPVGSMTVARKPIIQIKE
ncbi:MAG: S8 family serine peptidase [Bacteroidota bacterium]